MDTWKRVTYTRKQVNIMGERKLYSKEFKEEAIRLAEKSGNITQVAQQLGIHQSILRRWKQELSGDGEKAFPGQGYVKDPEVVRLEKENNRLKQENEILKKAVGIRTSTRA
jgi:transposase